MPIMNGLDFIKIAHCEYPDIQIVVLSGYDYFEYVREALLNGAVDYVLKPTINPDELLKILNRTAGQIPELQIGAQGLSEMDLLLEEYMTDRQETEDKKTEQTLTEMLPSGRYRLFILPMRKREPGRASFREGAELSRRPVILPRAEVHFTEGYDVCGAQL